MTSGATCTAGTPGMRATPIPANTNSEGAGVHVQQSHFVAANSRGFIGGYPYSRHTISVAPIGSTAPVRVWVRPPVSNR